MIFGTSFLRGALALTVAILSTACASRDAVLPSLPYPVAAPTGTPTRSAFAPPPQAPAPDEQVMPREQAPVETPAPEATPETAPPAPPTAPDGPVVGDAIPPAIGLDGRSVILPGSNTPNRGLVRALVLPVALGPAGATWTEAEIAAELVGRPRPGIEGAEGVAGWLQRESQSRFRLEAEVFPFLTTPDVTDAAVLDAATLEGLTADVFERWAQERDLAAFDNDGADGAPSSGDDDGSLDLVIVLVQTDDVETTRRILLSGTLSRDKGFRRRGKDQWVEVLAVPRTRGLENFGPSLARAILGAMGLGGGDAFFAAEAEAGVRLSSVARLRLGWLPGRWANAPATYRLPVGEALVTPRLDVDGYRGLWVIENDGERLFATRIARTVQGEVATVETRGFDVGQVLPSLALTRVDGPHGPRVEAAWRPTGEVNVDLVRPVEVLAPETAAGR